MIPTPLRNALAGALLAASVPADVLILEQPGLGTFTDPQTAVDAAPVGSTLLFLRGTYPGFAVARGMTLHAPAEGVLIQGSVQVTGLPAGETLRLIGLEIEADGGSTAMAGSHALELSTCLGSVLVDGCRLVGGQGGQGDFETETVGDGGHGLLAADSATVVVLDSVLEGGLGGSYFATAICCEGGLGGRGLSAQSTAVAVYDSTLRGGRGGSGGVYGGGGGHGLLSGGPSVLASGSSFQGGIGGTGTDIFALSGGDGGNGVHLTAGVEALLMDNAYAGGAGGTAGVGDPGSPGQGLFQPGGPPAELAVAHRGLTGTREAVAAGGTLQLELEGRPGDEVFLAFSPVNAVQLLERPPGVWVGPRPQLMTVEPAGVLPASGALQVQADVPDLVPGQRGASWSVQAFVRAANGRVRIGGAHLFTFLDPTLLPDCNGNGQWDLLDVAQGATDLNGDGAIDSCGVAEVWVDGSAPLGGDGSMGSPFANLASAFAVIGDGSRVHVQAGTYSGPDNRDLDLAGRAVTVDGIGGAGDVLIKPGPEMWITNTMAGEGSLTLRGVTVRDGTGSPIFLPDTRATLDGCEFINNVSVGSAVYVGPGSEVVDSFFGGNRADNDFASGGALQCKTPVRVHRSTFDNNYAGREGGAIFVDYDLPGTSDSTWISHSIFRANSSNSRGGAIYVLPQLGDVRIDHCFFALNELLSGIGGGAIALQGGSSVDIGSSTFVANSCNGTFGGGALLAEGTDEVTVLNSVLWDNVATPGPAITVRNVSISVPAECNVAYTDLQGGTAALGLLGTVVVNAGPGTIDLDPLFENPLVGDYRLGPGSPCIDAGDTTQLFLDLQDVDGNGVTQEGVPLDLLFNARAVDDPLVVDTGVGSPVVDMGAFERQP